MKSYYFLAKDLLDVVDTRIRDYDNSRGRDNYYLYGVIALANPDGTYNVLVNKDTWTLKPSVGKTFAVTNIVMILVPNGDKDNMFIDRVRPW